MANPPVLADVVDLRYDIPRSTDAFLVDTNVWYRYSYPLATLANRPPEVYQTADYPSYIKTCISQGARLFRTGLVFAELASVIERTEWEAFCRRAQRVFAKAYRHMVSERRNVVRQIITSWRIVESVSRYLDLEIDADAELEALVGLAFRPLDGVNALLVAGSLRRGVTQIITDDGDFAAVPGITVFTANPRTVNEARKRRRLTVR